VSADLCPICGHHHVSGTACCTLCGYSQDRPPEIALPEPATPADIIVGWACLGRTEEAAALHRIGGECRFCQVDRGALWDWIASGAIATADDRLGREPRRKAAR
jgi:hypothetical protein